MSHNICPYTLQPLASRPKVNDEHIFPDAIGGVLDYKIVVDAKKNSDLGSSIDAPLVSSPLIAGFRLMHGIKSRSGDPKWKLRGRIKGTKIPIEVTLSASEPLDMYVVKPVEMDDSGKGRAVCSLPDREKFLSDLVASFARKGKKLEIGSEISVGNQCELDLPFDEGLLKRAMLKIAYAALYEYLGDDFLTDPLIPEWHKAIFAPTNEEALSAKIHGQAFNRAELLKIMLPDLQPHEHAVSIANFQQQGPIVAVSLFGASFHHLIVLASETSTYGLKLLEGKIAICDSKAAKTRFMPFEDHFQNMKFPPLINEA